MAENSLNKFQEDLRDLESVSLEKRGADGKGKELLFEDVEELIAMLKPILTKMKESIEKAEFTLVIGDDASGRIPALVLQKFLKTIYEAKGVNPPKIIFIAGSGRDRELNLDQKREDIKSLLSKIYSNGKVLIVTDTLLTGIGLEPLTDSLKSLEIPFEILSLIFVGNDLGRLSTKLGGTIHSGGSGWHPGVYKASHLSGVDKNPLDLHSKRIASDDPDKAKLDQRIINEARRDVDLVSEKLITFFKNLK